MFNSWVVENQSMAQNLGLELNIVYQVKNSQNAQNSKLSNVKIPSSFNCIRIRYPYLFYQTIVIFRVDTKSNKYYDGKK